ncbi:hypothetical protein JZ751_020893 [Albula glossodonta]|uniref:Uncharacterized protein n=1 Tax=Albula glossodonta TaxID=121402 RepID=A0A8T2PJP8_9TELE|nr:hypothetical protein JZ751_020893 [Albula glossodonta]
MVVKWVSGGAAVSQGPSLTALSWGDGPGSISESLSVLPIRYHHRAGVIALPLHVARPPLPLDLISHSMKEADKNNSKRAGSKQSPSPRTSQSPFIKLSEGTKSFWRDTAGRGCCEENPPGTSLLPDFKVFHLLCW